MPYVEYAKILHTPRLTLTSLDLTNHGDMDMMIALFNDPVALARQGDFGIKNDAAVHRFADPAKLSHKTHVAAYRKRNRPVPEGILKAPGPAYYVVRLGPNNPGGERIGVIMFMESSPQVPHIGWMTFQRHSKKGYTTEAAKEVLRYWREDFGIDGIMALTDVDNPGSYGIALKLGMLKGRTNLLMKNGVREVSSGAQDLFLNVYLLPGMEEFPEGTVFDLHGREPDPLS